MRGRAHKFSPRSRGSPGIRINTGPNDFFPIEQMQLGRFDGEHWVLFGELFDASRKLGGGAGRRTCYRRGKAQATNVDLSAVSRTPPSSTTVISMTAGGSVFFHGRSERILIE